MRTDPFKRGRVAGSDAKDLRARKGQNCASGERDCAHHEFADVVRERVSVPDRSEERVPSALGRRGLWSVHVLVLAVLRGEAERRRTAISGALRSAWSSGVSPRAPRRSRIASPMGEVPLAGFLYGIRGMLAVSS